MPTCRSCYAPIWWAVTENGRRIPIDDEPDPTGNLVIVGADVVVRYLTKGEDPPPGDRYVTHFATCPNAEHHRRP